MDDNHSDKSGASMIYNIIIFDMSNMDIMLPFYPDLGITSTYLLIDLS
jgi:hypothetical protein